MNNGVKTELRQMEAVHVFCYGGVEAKDADGQMWADKREKHTNTII